MMGYNIDETIDQGTEGGEREEGRGKRVHIHSKALTINEIASWDDDAMLAAKPAAAPPWYRRAVSAPRSR